MDGLLRRLALGLTLLAAAAAGASAMAWLTQDRAATPIWLTSVAAGLVFFVLIAGVAAANLTARRVSRLRADLDTLSLAMDKAVRDLADRSDRDARSSAEANAALWDTIEGLRSKAPVRETPAATKVPAREPESASDNVVPYPHSKVARKPSPAPLRASENSADVGALVHQAVTSKRLELSLRPIISMTRGAAAGFDVFAHFDTGSGGLDLPANADEIPEAGRAAFESLVLDEAIDTARRRFGSVSQAMPLHVSVTKAFLLDAPAVDRFVDAARANEPLANAVVLSVPAMLADRDEPAFQALQTIAESGVRVALEDLPATSEIEFPAALQIAFVKVSTRRLLDDPASRRELPALALAAGAMVIAVDVDCDEDAIALIDGGISLMSGARFSGPRRLRPDDEGAIERISRVSVNNG